MISIVYLSFLLFIVLLLLISFLILERIKLKKSIIDCKNEVEALSSSEKLFRVMTTKAADAVFFYSLEKKQHFKYVSPAITTITGYTPEEIYANPRLAVENISHEDLVHLNNVQINGGNFTGRYTRKDGEIVWIQAHLTAIRDDKDNLVAFEGIVRDVTEYKKTEIALAESNKRNQSQVDYLNTLMDSMNEGLIIFDKNSIISFTNMMCKKILGYKPEDMVGKNVVEFIVEEFKEKLKKEINLTLEKGLSNSIAVQILHKDGVDRFIRLSISAINENNEIKGGILLAEDITERKQWEETSEIQKRFFKQLFENSPEAIAIINNEGIILDANKGFEKLFHYTQDDAISSNIDDLVLPKSHEMESLFVSVKQGDGIFHEETTRMRKDGSLVDVSILGYPIVFGGEKVGMYVLYSDITARKQKENYLEYLCLHDPLTDLYNRTFLEQEMHKKGKQGIIICDVDGLKLVNDTMGHKSGDNLILAVAGLLKKTVCNKGSVIRIGGDEFAVIIKDRYVNEIDSIVKEIKDEKDAYNSKEPLFPLSLSIGCAVNEDEASDIINIFKEADNKMYREKLCNSQSTKNVIIREFFNRLKERGIISETITEKLRNLSVDLAVAVGLSEHDVNSIRILASFHDIGKVCISDKTLLKTGKLKPDELAEIRRHTEIGYRIALSIPDMAACADCILKHHEWWDGNGYPLGLKGNDIPIQSRIVSIAEAYIAMTSNRPYRHALSHEEALNELQRYSGTQFDPDVVKIAINLMRQGTVP